MLKTKYSPRVREIEQKHKQPIEKLLHKWHWSNNLMHKEIGEKLNIPRPTITRWFKELKVPTQSCTRFTNLNLEKARQRRSLLKKPRVLKPRPWKVNETFFHKWSEDMAYVLGFFCADGFMFKNPRGSRYIGFQITDKNILVKIKNLLGTGHKLEARQRIENHKPIWHIQIGSRKMYEKLVSLGVTPRKSYRIRIPKTLPQKYTRDFIRGYFDGDGHISFIRYQRKDRKNISTILQSGFTSCSKGMLSGISQNLYEKAGMREQKTRQRNNYFVITYSTKDSQKLYKYLYKSNPRLYLNRKKKVFEQYIGGRSVIG